MNQIIAKQDRVDSYLSGNLKDFLAKIETQVAAQGGADSKIEKISQGTSESRHVLMTLFNSLVQDIKELKEATFKNRQQDPLRRCRLQNREDFPIHFGESTRPHGLGRQSNAGQWVGRGNFQQLPARPLDLWQPD